jgi:hypothetical protein
MSHQRTRADLIKQTLIEIEVLASGQAVEVEDFETVDAFIDPSLAMFDALGIVSVPDADEIPIEIFIPVSKMLGKEVANSFGITGQELVDVFAAAAAAERQLRIIRGTKPTGEVQESTYF